MHLHRRAAESRDAAKDHTPFIRARLMGQEVTMVLDTGATTSVLYTLRVQQLDRGPQLLSTAQAQGTAAGPFSSSQPARRVECDLAVRGVVGPVRWILAQAAATNHQALSACWAVTGSMRREAPQR